MRTTIAAASALALLGSQPVSAQTFIPELAASRFCELRSMGVSVSDALQASVNDSWASLLRPTPVQYRGKLVDSNYLVMANRVGQTCPDLTNDQPEGDM